MLTISHLSYKIYYLVQTYSTFADDPNDAIHGEIIIFGMNRTYVKFRIHNNVLKIHNINVVEFSDYFNAVNRVDMFIKLVKIYLTKNKSQYLS